MKHLPSLIAAFLLLAPPCRGGSIQATARPAGESRLISLEKEGDEIYVPLFACGALLGAESRWHRDTNRWEIAGMDMKAQGFLDEPLVEVSRQPLLVKNPPRIINGAPFLSLEVFRLLGRHGWEVEVVWDDSGKELTIKAAQPQAVTAAKPSRILKPPAIPPGTRVIVIDPGHRPRSGVRGARGMTEGDAGQNLAAALSATLISETTTVVLMRQGVEDLEPWEVAGLANSVKAELFVSFHASEGGTPGLAVWNWSLKDMLSSRIDFEPFEPGKGWSHISRESTRKSARIAENVLKSLAESGIPAHGPLSAPLLCLEGLFCPAIAIEVQGLQSPGICQMVSNEDMVATIAGAIAAAIRAELSPEAGTPE